MTRTSITLFVAGLFLLDAGCQRADSNTNVPRHFVGHQWHKIQAQHITMYTNLSVSSARRSMEAYDFFVHQIHELLADQPLDSTGTIDLVIFRNRRQFESITGERISYGFLQESGINGQNNASPAIVMYDQPNRGNISTFIRAVTTRHLSEVDNRFPKWASEGLAEYLGAIQTRNGELVFGLEPIYFRVSDSMDYGFTLIDGYFVAIVPIGHLIPPSQVASLPTTELSIHAGSDSEKYDAYRKKITHAASAWAIMHLLYHGPEAYRKRILELIRSNDTNTNSTTASAETSLAELDHAFYEHMRTRTKVIFQKHPVETHPGQISNPSPLDVDEVIQLFGNITGPTADECETVSRALQHASGNTNDGKLLCL